MRNKSKHSENSESFGWFLILRPIQFVTDPGVRLFATLSLDLGFTYAAKTRREIRVTMEFGDTEIRASAIDVFSGNTIKASFDFLDDKRE